MSQNVGLLPEALQLEHTVITSLALTGNSIQRRMASHRPEHYLTDYNQIIGGLMASWGLDVYIGCEAGDQCQVNMEPLPMTDSHTCPQRAIL